MTIQIKIDRLSPWRLDDSRTADVAGWDSRFSECPAQIRQNFRDAKDGPFKLLYRGVKENPGDDLFKIGNKAKPFYMTAFGDELSRHAKEIIRDATSFRELAEAFAASKMAKKYSCASSEELSETFNRSDDRKQFRLAEILLYSLQFQNCELPGNWAERLLLLSASFDAQIALRYALAVRPNEPPVSQAYVIEYAPPMGEKWFEPVKDIIVEFEELGLGKMFPDWDKEAFIPLQFFRTMCLALLNFRVTAAKTTRLSMSRSTKLILI